MESVLGLVRHPGNDALFQALEMSLLAALAGQPLHIHAEGLRGTGKTTIMRAVRRVLPRIRRIKGCLYNCDPLAPHCPAHRGLTPQEVAELGDERVPMPFLEISHAAKIGTVVGSIDLGRLVRATEPEAALLPGTIPQAHRGIIFVDEINRLAETSPELADVLLDVMGTKPGRVQIEETGLPPVELPAQVTVWAASNPDEDPGPLEEIRRQLSDRFDFAIYADRPGDPEVVERILAMADAAPARPAALAETQAELWRTRLSLRMGDLRRIEVPPAIRQEVAGLYSRYELESLRAVQAIQTGVRLAACLDNRKAVQPIDLQRIAPMALRHRVDPDTMRRVANQLSGAPEKVEVQPAAGRARFPGLSMGAVVAQESPPSQQADDGQGAPAFRGASAVSGRVLAAYGGASSAQAGAPATRAGTSAAQVGTSTVHRGTSAAPAGPSASQGGPSASQWGPSASQVGTSASRLGTSTAQVGTPTAHRGAPMSHGSASAAAPAQVHGAEPGRTAESWFQRTLSQLGISRPNRTEERQPGLDRRVDRSARLPDPAEHPPEAPPNQARPLSTLSPDEWVRTEEELGRR